MMGSDSGGRVTDRRFQCGEDGAAFAGLVGGQGVVEIRGLLAGRGGRDGIFGGLVRTAAGGETAEQQREERRRDEVREQGTIDRQAMPAGRGSGRSWGFSQAGWGPDGPGSRRIASGDALTTSPTREGIKAPRACGRAGLKERWPRDRRGSSPSSDPSGSCGPGAWAISPRCPTLIERQAVSMGVMVLAAALHAIEEVLDRDRRCGRAGDHWGPMASSFSRLSFEASILPRRDVDPALVAVETSCP